MAFSFSRIAGLTVALGCGAPLLTGCADFWHRKSKVTMVANDPLPPAPEHRTEVMVPAPDPTPPPAPPKLATTKHPAATAVPGREGFVFSPFNNKLIDVKGFARGALVADPHYPVSEKMYFRVP